MNKMLVGVALLFIISLQTFSQEKSFKLQITVKDQENKTLAGLPLYFESKIHKTTSYSDENGIIKAELPIGYYKVTTNQFFSKDFVGFLKIVENGINPTNFDYIITPNMSCCDKTSDGKNTEVLEFFAPHYPPAAKATGTSGEVIVEIKIDSEGKVINSKVIGGHVFLRAIAEVTAKKWIFTKDESSVERGGNLIFSFIQSELEKPKSDFRKPNRIEVWAEKSTLNFYKSGY